MALDRERLGFVRYWLGQWLILSSLAFIVGALVIHGANDVPFAVVMMFLCLLCILPLYLFCVLEVDWTLRERAARDRRVAAYPDDCTCRDCVNARGLNP